MDSLHDDNFAVSFGRERFGVARWGLFKLLQEAEAFDRISLYSLDFNSNELFYPLKAYPGGDWMVIAPNCELYFFQPGSGKAGIGLSEFIDTINKKAEENVGVSDMGGWRPATLQYHWYRLDGKFYGDFYKGSHMPDLYMISGSFKIIGGAALGYIHDRYGNQYYSTSGGGALGYSLAEKWEGYATTVFPLDRRFKDIPSEENLKKIITGFSITFSGSIGTSGVGYTFWKYGSIALFGGYQASFGAFLSGGITWEASTKDYMKAWSWVDDKIPNFGFPSIP